ncbi:hypothetical protein JCM10213v2_006670 [Rhodosporidiobolus nylandii]
MDPDPSFYAQHLSQPSTPLKHDPESAPSSPFVPPTLASPRPSLSPSVSRVFTRPQLDKAPSMNGGLDLSQPDIARARAERASRLSRQNALHSPSSGDNGETLSARQNILNLVQAGQMNAKEGGSTPSLASFMGGGAQRRVHKVNSGMTEQEREETERLEKEMAQTRARWGNKSAEGSGPPSGGMSLAALMKGETGGASPAPSSPAARRWQPSSASVEQSPAAAPAPATEEPAPPSPPKPATPLVEAKLVSRSIPESSAQSDELPSPPVAAPPPTAATAPTEFGFPATSSPPSASPPLDTASRPISAGAADTLTRLRSKSIVAERLKWGESKSSSDVANAPSAPSSPVIGRTSAADKRRSVLERWGRDQPNEPDQPPGSPVAPAALRSPPPFPVETSRPPAPEERREQALRTPASPAMIGVAEVEQVDVAPTKAEGEKAVEEEGVVPKLVHITASSARPAKSTPRTLSSAASTANASSTSSRSFAAEEQPAGDKKGYAKPTWSAAPIGVKPASSASSPALAASAEEEPQELGRKHTRGVALPGLSSAPAFRPVPAGSPSIPAAASAPAEIPASPARASGGTSGVRALAMRWGQQKDEDDEAKREKEERQKALKASYGVRVGVETPRSPVKQRTWEAPPPEKQDEAKRADSEQVVFRSAASELAKPKPKPVPVVTPTPEPFSAPVPAPAVFAAPAPPPPSGAKSAVLSASSAAASKDNASFLLSLLSAQPPSPSLPAGAQTASLDVFRLNAFSDAAATEPIDHNYMLHSNEILGIVWRSMEGEARTWVWRGRDAQETNGTSEMVDRLERKMGAKPVEVRQGKEPADLGQAFEGQVTICRRVDPTVGNSQGDRRDFDHLSKRLYSVSSHDGVVFVDELDIAARSLCSGFCTTFSTVGEVFAWLGEGSTDAERQACCEWAEGLADGRAVTVLEEGEETALFWHELDGGEYAGAYYWRHRPLHPSSPASVLSFSAAKPVLVPSLRLSTSSVTLIDGGFAELWVVVPADARAKKDEIAKALAAAETLAYSWEDRGFEARTPFHVITFPSLIPRDLPFLSRALDFAPLNAGERPTKMHVYTPEEAREELL